MTAIEKARETIRRALIDMNAIDRLSKIAGVHPFTLLRQELVETLAALEAEKPAEDVLTIARGILNTIKVFGIINISPEKLSVMINEYAETYHAKKCAECKKPQPLPDAPKGQP